jgi:hypothetical protein
MYIMYLAWDDKLQSKFETTEGTTEDRRETFPMSNSVDLTFVCYAGIDDSNRNM